MNKELLEQTKYLTELLQLFLEHEDVEWFELEGGKEEFPGLFVKTTNISVDVWVEGELLAIEIDTVRAWKELIIPVESPQDVYKEIRSVLEKFRKTKQNVPLSLNPETVKALKKAIEEAKKRENNNPSS